MSRFLALAILFFPLLAWGRTGSITGQIMSNEGEPVVGAAAYLLHTELGDAADEYGQYSIANVPPGKYALKMASIGYDPQYTILEVLADSTLVVDGVLTEADLWFEPLVYMPEAPATRPGNATLSGTVKNAGDGSPLDAVWVTLHMEGMDSAGRGWTYPAHGGRSAKAGQYAVHDIKPGYYTAYTTADRSLYQITKLKFQADETLEIDFQLPGTEPGDTAGKPGRVVGRVWDQARRAVLPGASVRLFDIDGSMPINEEGFFSLRGVSVFAAIDSAATNIQGAFLLPAVPPGEYLLEIHAEDLYTCWRQVKITGGRDYNAGNVVLKPDRRRTQPSPDRNSE